MIELKHSNRNTLKFFKSLFDEMIPESIDKKLPKLSKATDVKSLLKVIFSDEDLKTKLKEILIPIFNNYKKTQDLDYSNLGKKISVSTKIGNLVEQHLLESYFTSAYVRKRLFQKTNTLLFVNKIKRKNISTLLKKIKNYKKRYKKI